MQPRVVLASQAACPKERCPTASNGEFCCLRITRLQHTADHSFTVAVILTVTSCRLHHTHCHCMHLSRSSRLALSMLNMSMLLSALHTADHSLTTHCGSLMHCRCHPLCHLLPLTSHCHGMHLSRSSRLALAMLHVHALPCPCLPCHCLALQRSHMLTMPMLTMSMLTMLLSSAVTNCRLHGTAMVMHIYRSGNEEDPRLYALSAKRKAHAVAPTKRHSLRNARSAATTGAYLGSVNNGAGSNENRVLQSIALTFDERAPNTNQPHLY
jgi:uncharacterized protein GlcG (DUF336 family)